MTIFPASGRPLAAVMVLALAPALTAATSIWGAKGLLVSVDPAGWYDIQLREPAWDFGGALGVPLTDVAVAAGTDRLGDYREIAFDFQTDAPRHAAIRAYQNQQAILFTLNCPSGAPNSLAFPVLSRYPAGLSHIAFAGTFAHYTFTSLPPESPWVFFDSRANTFIVSAAANFMVAQNSSGPDGEIYSGIAPAIATLPEGFTHKVLLVADAGVNRAFDTWGHALTDLQGKTRPANDADVSLNKLSYWTDNGATYYYRTETSGTASALVQPAGPYDGSNPYEQTLWGAKSSLDSLSVGLGSLQLDSWFYPKGPDSDWTDCADGINQYVAAPALFGSSLASFQRSIGVPLITHARWIDASSPYRQMYQMSGNVAIDPRYWSDIAQYLKSSGVAVYEQDWLSAQAQTAFNLTDPDAFLDNMAGAMAAQGIDMQYCMATPRHFLQTAKYNNLTSIRASGDRFETSRWSAFLYASRLAGALGVWPFTDVFMSSETGNLILAALSAGPVGLGDRIGGVNAANLLRAARPDGVIVKPDAPLTPIDSSFVNEAQVPVPPMIASTYTDFGDLRTYYLFAYSQGSNSNARFALSDFGAAGPVYLYDYLSDTGNVVSGDGKVEAPVATGFRYLIAAPVGASGMAILGDTGQFVSMGKKRVASLTDDGTVRLTVLFAPGEGARIIQGYSPGIPRTSAEHGFARLSEYNANTDRFRVSVSPGPDGTATIVLRPGTPAGRMPR